MTAGTTADFLVPYAGPASTLCSVSALPPGWVVQGTKAYRLTIAPADDPDTEPDSFTGKLVVTLASAGITAPTGGADVAVGAARGQVVRTDPSTPTLFFTEAAGRLVDVQVPAALGWTDAQIGEFGAVISVGPDAMAGQG